MIYNFFTNHFVLFGLGAVTGAVATIIGVIVWAMYAVGKTLDDLQRASFEGDPELQSCVDGCCG